MCVCLFVYLLQVMGCSSCCVVLCVFFYEYLLSQSHLTTGGLPPISSSWRQALWDSRHRNFIFQLNIFSYSPYVTYSIMRGRICRLQLLLVLASAVILRSESRGTHDHIRDSPNMEGQVPVFISPRNRLGRLYPQAVRSLFIASYDFRIFFHVNGRGNSLRWPHNTLYPQSLALTSLTSGGRSVGGYNCFKSW
jgi:hypothetical protein